jgi:hypothetical protein
MYEKTDKNGLYRDLSSGGIVNNDGNALVAYKLRKQRANELKELKDRQESLENDVSEIKTMLTQILGKI